MSHDEERASFAERYNVSRETLLRLDRYYQELKLWANRINLVSKSTLDDFWTRHALDSAQVIDVAGGELKSFIDMGTGAGFPGLILATLISQKHQDYDICLVDTNSKRCAFLREAARLLDLKITIKNQKIEEVVPKKYDFVTARAFAPLNVLLPLSLPYSQLGARLLFLKGEDVENELKETSTNWDFCYKTTPSISHKLGCILEISELKHRAK